MSPERQHQPKLLIAAAAAAAAAEPVEDVEVAGAEDFDRSYLGHHHG